MRYHKAVEKIIPPGSNDPAIKPVGMIFHVAVSESDSLYDYFAHRSGGIESHFYVRNDGTVEQYRDTDFEADAQYKGNSFFRNGQRCGFLSVETEGMGVGTWTDAQVKSLIELGQWAADNYHFKRQQTPGPYSDGFGYHAMFRDWNPSAHTCPGAARIKQFRDVLLPALTTKPKPPTRVALAQHLLTQAHDYAVKKGWKRRAAALAKKIQTGPNR